MNASELSSLAAEVRGMSDDEAEAAYTRLRDRLREDYQHIAGSVGRNRAREIAKLRGSAAPPAGGGPLAYDIAYHKGSKADRLEEALQRDNEAYEAGMVRKTMLAVRTGRLDWWSVGGTEFAGPGLEERARKRPDATITPCPPGWDHVPGGPVET